MLGFAADDDEEVVGVALDGAGVEVVAVVDEVVAGLVAVVVLELVEDDEWPIILSSL